MTSWSHLTWRKASASSAQGSDCVEVATLPGGGRAVRDSMNPVPTLWFDAGAWQAFLGGLKAGTLGV